MPRIDVTDDERWAWRCPECGSTDWRANDGTFECRAERCGYLGTRLKHAASGETYERAEIEFVGPNVDWKAPYATGSRG